VAVAELFVAIHVYVLFTPTASDPLDDHKPSVSRPSAEVFSWRSVGPVWAPAGVAIHTASDMAAAAVVHEKALNENFIGKSLSGWVALSESRAKRVALRPARGQGASTRSRDERQIGGQDAIDLAQNCPIHRLPLRSKPRPAVILPNDKADATAEIVWVATVRRLTVPVDWAK
jgi:hypothetical protein